MIQLIRTAWRHRLVAIATLAAVMGATGTYVALQAPTYQSTITLQLTSSDPTYLDTINSTTAVYSALLTSPDTLSLAQSYQPTTPLGQISVRTFADSPVLKVEASAGAPDQAQISAHSVVTAMGLRVQTQALGIAGISVVTVDGPSPAVVVWPRPALTLGAAAVAGLLLALFTAWLADRPWRSVAVSSRRTRVAAPLPLAPPNRRRRPPQDKQDAIAR